MALVAALPAHAAIPIEHWMHASGARVYLVSSPSIPMLDVQADFDGGSRREPVRQAGLASVTAGLLSGGVAAQGGQPALDENALSEAWLDIGAQFGASASGDYGLSNRNDGSRQWTYRGKPLYFWSGDQKPGDMMGDNIGNVWHVVRP